VAVDLRKGSPTFLHYYEVNLSENNPQCFFIPEGFAHGFQTLVPNCEMLYFHTEDYNSVAEGVINSNDPRISIKWPKFITESSERDNNSLMLDKDFLGIKI
jgi:dTDP-4-dehydrorhamnose 3,5-epimerase